MLPTYGVNVIIRIITFTNLRWLYAPFLSRLKHIHRTDTDNDRQTLRLIHNDSICWLPREGLSPAENIWTHTPHKWSRIRLQLQIIAALCRSVFAVIDQYNATDSASNIRPGDGTMNSVAARSMTDISLSECCLLCVAGGRARTCINAR